ncbi:hypothetical protein [Ornithobacterium rhinotracheale]|uniref:hypothetical protein n=1 Tax=Ornithobacterium rhinotracheale TaxID=28251 RepID=UPI003FD092F7
MNLPRVLSVANILNFVVTRVPFEGVWYDAFKQPQDRGFWFIWGTSASGKSSFAMQLAKEMSKHYKTLYNLLEEEPDDSDFIDRNKLFTMQDVAGNFGVQKFNLEELNFYLEKRNSPKVVIIDSLPYFMDSFEQYLDFKQKWWRKKIIIFIAHADGAKPSSRVEERIMFDAKMKIFVSGYLAKCKGRTIGPNGGNFIIWKEGYEALQGEKSTEEIKNI